MNIIFLDIDGTLNRSQFDAAHFDPACVAAFNRILAATDAKIVITSTWRGLIHNGHMDLFGFGKLLRSHGIHGVEVIGCTRPAAGDEPRWRQIADWLKRPAAKIDRYCILDDDPDAFGGRPGVQTAGGVGLTEADADAAIEILKP